jgi:hemerythrin-like metal-binding protein
MARKWVHRSACEAINAPGRADKPHMSMFEWKSEYSLGHGDIDGEHRRLFELASELHAAMLNGKGKESLSQTLHNLVIYTKEHFSHEERLMQLHHYPEYPEHKAAHDALTARVIEFQQEFEAGRAGVTIELLQFLKDWLRTHIGETDHRVAMFLKSKAA